jgi:DNA-binding NarL/FixJ family response regulator
MAARSKPRQQADLKRVFIVEDHPVFRQGLAQMLKQEADFAICGEAGDAETGFPAIMESKPDVVLIDITLPGKSGLELIKRIRAQDTQMKLLVVSMHDEALYANRVLRAGGDGYIMKQEAPEEIVNAVRDVLAGHVYLSEAVLGISDSPKTMGASADEAKNIRLDQLTDSELELLEMLGRGRTAAELARDLKVGTSTINNRCTQIRKKLRLKTADQLTRYAIRWVETDAG